MNKPMIEKNVRAGESRNRMNRTACVAVLAIGLGSLVSACVQAPTERVQAVELRGQLAFVMQNPAAPVDGLRVIVDGLDVGPLAALVTGSGGARELKVLPGPHQLRIDSPMGPLLDERIFVGEGATKTVLVPTR